MQNFRLMAMAAIVLCCLTHRAKAQLWRYLNYDPKKEEQFEKELDSRAYKVTHKKAVAYGDTVDYDLRTFRITSFDGRPVDLDFWDRAFDNHVFHIELPTGKWEMRDFYVLNDIKVINKYLIEFDYSPRGGSNQGFEHMMFLGVDKGKLCIVADIQSTNEYAMPDAYGLWHLTTKFTGHTPMVYRVEAWLQDLCKSTQPGKSFDRKSNYTLKFDTTQKVFYTALTPMDFKAHVWDNNARKPVIKQIKGTFPEIKIDTERYVFINGTWYTVYKDDKLGYQLNVYSAMPVKTKKHTRG